MQFEILTDIPLAPERDWFEERYCALAAELAATDEGAPAARWVALARHWNELRAVVRGEQNRRAWAESGDVRDPAARAAAHRFRNEIAPLATREDAALRRRFLEPAARAALEPALGSTLLGRWQCQTIAADPRNVDLDVEASNLVTEYGRLRGQAEVVLRGEKRTLTQLANLGESPDPELRREAFEATLTFSRAHEATCESIFARLVELRTRAGRNLGFGTFTPLGYQRMSRTDWGPAEAARFRELLVEHAVPLLADLRARQARELGTPLVRACDRSFFPGDALAPDAVPVAGQVEAARLVFGALHPRLRTHWDDMVARGLADIGNRPGKQPGAYCTSMPDTGEVRIFCNSTGAASDVATLVHECGHAFQARECQGVEMIELRWPTLEAAEIHSMGLEYLAFPHLGAFFATEADAARFRRQKLARSVVLLAQVAAGDAFQHEVYARPDMSGEERSALWASLWQTHLPGEDWSGLELDRARSWHRQPHIYGTPFYYLDYGLAEACALQLFALSKEDPTEALARYLRLCEIGGQRTFLGILEAAGLASPFDPETLPRLVAVLRRELAL